MKKVTWIVVALIVVSGFFFRNHIYGAWLQISKPTLPEPRPYQPSVNRPVYGSVNQPVNESPDVEPQTPPEDEPPVTDGGPAADPEPVNLDVPFQSQAPHADWSLPYKEACEESSAIMVDYYLKNRLLSADAMDQEILKLAAWEEENGYAIDISILELERIVEEYYGYKADVIEPLTKEKIAQQLELGRPIIIPAAGRELGNPYYTPPGPPYHMLVIKGIASNGHYITNDPGTRHGGDFLYDPDILLPAVRDWDGEAAEGFRRGLVMYK